MKGLKKYFPVRRGFLQKIIGWIKAVDDVDLEIGRGKTLGLVGESGCGKTTVGRLILRLIEADAGQIVFRNQDITALPPEEMKPLRKEMQIIFQDPFGSLNPRMTVGQAIGASSGRSTSRRGTMKTGLMGRNHGSPREKIIISWTSLNFFSLPL